MKRRFRFWLIFKLGGIPLNHRAVRKWKQEDYDKSVAYIRGTIEKSDKVYMEQVTLVGDHQTIDNCTIFAVNGNPGILVKRAVAP